MARAVDFEDCGIAEAISKYRLKVPVNQRSYKWEDEHVQDLFTDLENAINQSAENCEYFLGTMVFIKGDDQDYEVADGQQRLATVVILFAAIRDYLFQDTSQSKLFTDIRKRYLLSFDMDKDDELPNLTLNLEDNDFFRRRILCDPGATGRIEDGNEKRQSHKLISGAAKLAQTFVQKITSTSNPSHRIERIKEWIKFLRDSARVILVKVPNPSKAFTIFETLNDRGLRLSQVDLLKNHIYGLASRSDRLGEAQRMWTEMYGALEANGREDLALDYIRQLWISYKGHVTAENLYDEIKGFAKSPAKAIELAEMLSSNAIQFTALLNPLHPYWGAHTDATIRCVGVLENNLRIDRIRPLLLAVLAAFENKKDVERAFRLCVSWAVRFLIVGGIGSGTIEKFYASSAPKLRNKELKTPQALADEMGKHVPSDEDFKNAFATANVSRSYYSRYYLHVLDRYEKDKGTTTVRDAALATDDEAERYDLEHVIPRKGDYPLDEETRLSLINRLGNQALMAKTDNSPAKSDTFDQKKNLYKRSVFVLTQRIGKSKSWGRNEVDEHQAYMAEMAPKAWPLKVV
ncbi:MAG: DUF262 domain-containing HNH endonuclease family protein [Tepidisphaeraceae bacterium]|jgi:hypothetical protein